MNIKSIQKLQAQYGFAETQIQIDNGSIWKFEGSVGRNAMALLESGACMLPLKGTFDYYGNRIPSRSELKVGTKGTYQNSLKFWQGVVDGKIEIDEWVDNED